MTTYRALLREAIVAAMPLLALVVGHPLQTHGIPAQTVATTPGNFGLIEEPVPSGPGAKPLQSRLHIGQGAHPVLQLVGDRFGLR